jgi:CDP-diacylglycerol--glycerol-3-phosphate 3-phosphatidyltransferase
MILWTSIPNILSVLRIISAPLLIALAYAHEQHYYAWLITAALISDILDGAIARYFGLVSHLGMLLDSAADLLVFVAAVYGLLCFFPDVVRSHADIFSFVVILWIATDLAGLLRYGRLASFHTYMSRITAYVLGGFFVVLFLWGFKAWLFWVAVFLVVVSHLEILVLLALLPTWSPDTRGVYWVIKGRPHK